MAFAKNAPQKRVDPADLPCCAPVPKQTGETITIAPVVPPFLRADELVDGALQLDESSLLEVCERILQARPKVLEKLSKSKTFSSVREAMQSQIRGELEMQMKTNGNENGNGHPALKKAPSMQASKLTMESKNTRASRTDLIKDLQADMASGVKQLPYLAYREELQERFFLRDKELYGEEPANQFPIIQFETAMNFCKEDNHSVMLGLMRIGDVSEPSSCTYETRDASAKAGVKYVAKQGTVYFEPGQRSVTISVEMIDDEAWDATLEFSVQLLSDNLQNCELGRYLHRTRVKIIDDDTFPTNKFRKQISAGQLDMISKPRLMIEYWKMNLRNAHVKRGTIKNLLADMIVNLNVILVLFMNLFLVDKVLCESCDPGNAPALLTLVVCLKLALFPFIHYLDYRKVYWLIAGVSRMTLQANMLRKFLHYNDESLAYVDESRLIMAMSRDSADLVVEGYCKMMPLISSLCRLIMLLMYQILLPYITGDADQMISASSMMEQLAPAFVFPIVMLAFLQFRNPRTLYYLEAMKNCQNRMLYHIRQTLKNYDLIRDYRQRGHYVDGYEQRIREYNKAWVNTQSIIANDKKFAPWLTLIFISLYTYFAGLKVVNGPLGLGSFLNSLATYQAIGDLWGEIYEILLNIQNTFDALNTMVEFLNLQTDVAHRMAVGEQNRQMVLETLALYADKPDRKRDPADLICIELRQFSFQFRSRGLVGARLEKSTACLPQGGLYTLVGPPSEGKGTVLRLLGEMMLPYVDKVATTMESGSGGLMIPTHLRALHIMRDPLFVEGTLYDNLCFGSIRDSDDTRMERVCGILRMLKMPEHIIQTTEKNDVVEDWLSILSSTECSLLHIARALVANPEIICIHKPALFLNTEMGDNVYNCLKRFVEHRGLDQDPAKFYRRRPRTVVLSARRVEGTGSAVADAVFAVSQDYGMHLIDPQSPQLGLT